MADEYPVLIGVVQKFGDKPPVASRNVEVQGEPKTVREFTVKAAGSQLLVRVSLWPEWAHVAIEEGDFIVSNGKFKVSEGETATFYQVTPFVLHVNGQKQVANREAPTTSQPAATAKANDTPF